MSCEFLKTTITDASALVQKAGPEGLALFQEPKWWEVIRDGFSVDCWSIKVVEDGVPVAVFPVFERKKVGFRLLGSPLPGTFTPYVGLIALRELTEAQKCFYLSRISKMLPSYGASYISLGFLEDEGICDQLLSQGKWQVEKSGTFRLDIHTDEQIMWKGMQGRGRNMVRKAEKNSVIVRTLEGKPEDIALFYKMLEGTFAKSGVLPPHPKVFYDALVRHLMPEGMLLFLAAELKGKIIAMGLFPYNRHEIHYLSGTSLPEAGKVAANNLIQWEVIKFALRNGIKIYDLGGVGIPSIDRFKASFGATLAHYQRYIWMDAWARIAYGVYLKTQPFVERTRFVLKRKIKI